MRSFGRGAIAAVALGVAALSGAPVSAEDMFAGKTITLVVGYAPGGGYDTYARLVAGHLGKFLPGQPTVVVENMEGGGARRAAVYLASAAPKDGTVIELVPSSIAMESVRQLIPGGLDAGAVGYIGRLTTETAVMLTSLKSATRTMEDARARETILSAASYTDASVVVPRVLNALAGTKFKTVEGYRGTAEMILAIERGEADGTTFSVPNIRPLHPDWLDKKAVNFLLTLAMTRSPVLPDTPAVGEFATTDEQRSIFRLLCSPADLGKALGLPPGTPAEILAAYRRAFDAMVRDSDFLAEAAKRKLAIEPATGSELEQIVKAVMATSPADVERLRQILGGG